MSVRVGDTVEIPCTFRPGAFSDERLVNIDTVEGPISGFVRVEDLHEMGAHEGAVKAIVRIVKDRLLEVRIRGSFFTTNGIATIDSSRILQTA